MDEILNVYRQFIEKGVVDASIYTYGNMNICIDGQKIHLYDLSGKMPCGNYFIMKTEPEFIQFLSKMSDMIGEVVDNNQFICGKCGKVHDLPEEKTDRNGNLVCAKCVNGGDFRIEHPKDPNKAKKDKAMEQERIPSTQDHIKKSAPEPAREFTIQDAIALLQKTDQYAVKKVVKSYKAVYVGDKGEGISSDFFRSKEDFEARNPGKKFVTFIKELNKADEEPV